MIHFALDRKRKTAIMVCQTDEEICKMKEEFDKIIDKNKLWFQRTTVKKGGR